MIRAEALLLELGDAPPLRDWEPARLRRHFPALEALLRDPAAAGDDLELWRLVLQLKRIGDRAGFIRLASWLFEEGREPLTRLKAAIQAGWGLVQLGRYDDARALLDRALAIVTPDTAAARPLIEGIHSVAAHDERDWSVAEAHVRRSLARLEALEDGALAALTVQSRGRLRHARLSNLAAIKLDQAIAEGGSARARLITEAEGVIEGGLAAEDCPADVAAMYRSNRGIVLRERGDAAAAITHYDALLAECAPGLPEAYVRPTALRDRALARLALGDREGAFADLRAALAESLVAPNSLEERVVAQEMVAALRAVRGGESRPVSELLDDLHVGSGGFIAQLAAFMREKDWQSAAGVPGAIASRALRIYRRLSGRLGAQPLDLELLEAGAHLHDIGKIQIPWSILNKPFPLSPWEESIDREHPEAGARILDSLGYARVGEIARRHHQRHDGGGYPDPAPLAEPHAAIIRVADAYELAISDHPLNPERLSPADAAERLRAGIGTRFHPAAVAALLESIR